MSKPEDEAVNASIDAEHEAVMQESTELDGAKLKAELDAARQVLRGVCEEFGDLNWSDNVPLSEALELHLWRHLRYAREMQSTVDKLRATAEPILGENTVTRVVMVGGQSNGQFRGAFREMGAGCIDDLLDEIHPLFNGRSNAPCERCGRDLSEHTGETAACPRHPTVHQFQDLIAEMKRQQAEDPSKRISYVPPPPGRRRKHHWPGGWRYLTDEEDEVVQYFDRFGWPAKG